MEQGQYLKNPSIKDGNVMIKDKLGRYKIKNNEPVHQQQ